MLIAPIKINSYMYMYTAITDNVNETTLADFNLSPLDVSQITTEAKEPENSDCNSIQTQVNDGNITTETREPENSHCNSIQTQANDGNITTETKEPENSRGNTIQTQVNDGNNGHNDVINQSELTWHAVFFSDTQPIVDTDIDEN